MSHDHDEIHEHDLGLQHDLGTLARSAASAGAGCSGSSVGSGSRRSPAGCGSDSSGTAATTDDLDHRSDAPRRRAGRRGAPAGGMGGDSGVEVADGEIPEETAGPYPGDGSNGPNVLTESGVVRSDITSSFGSASGVADGRPADAALQGLRPHR